MLNLIVEAQGCHIHIIQQIFQVAIVFQVNEDINVTVNKSHYLLSHVIPVILF